MKLRILEEGILAMSYGDNLDSFFVSFVILHYLDLETTVKCVNLILSNINYSNYSIVIVDNASPNNSGAKLKELYQNRDNIDVLISKENLGFARGNNLGYAFAKKNYNSNFIIVANNDVMFEEPGLVTDMIRIFSEKKCHVLGPDIETPAGYHQNPIRSQMPDKRRIKRKLFNKSVFLYYLKIKQLFHLENKIHILERIYEKETEKVMRAVEWKLPQENAVLHGACLMFTPLFVEKEDMAFMPLTFMYGEEELLANMCEKKHYKMCYSPELKVLHLGEQSTKIANGGSNRFYNRMKNEIIALRILLKEMN